MVLSEVRPVMESHSKDFESFLRPIKNLLLLVGLSGLGTSVRVKPNMLKQFFETTEKSVVTGAGEAVRTCIDIVVEL